MLIREGVQTFCYDFFSFANVFTYGFLNFSMRGHVAMYLLCCSNLQVVIYVGQRVVS